MRSHRRRIVFMVAGLLGLVAWLGQAGAQDEGAAVGSGETATEEGAAAEETATPDSGDHGFVGVEQCGRCHRIERTGNQLGVWEASAHSRAYEALASPDALAIGVERGIENPQESPECLRCHVTAYGVPAERLGEHFDPTAGVQCESCHGAGADYSPAPVMRDREAALAAGLVLPDEAVCTGCHNADSPTFQSFDFATAAATIAHPDPRLE